MSGLSGAGTGSPKISLNPARQAQAMKEGSPIIKNPEVIAHIGKIYGSAILANDDFQEAVEATLKGLETGGIYKDDSTCTNLRLLITANKVKVAFDKAGIMQSYEVFKNGTRKEIPEHTITDTHHGAINTIHDAANKTSNLEDKVKILSSKDSILSNADIITVVNKALTSAADSQLRTVVSRLAAAPPPPSRDASSSSGPSAPSAPPSPSAPPADPSSPSASRASSPEPDAEDAASMHAGSPSRTPSPSPALSEESVHLSQVSSDSDEDDDLSKLKKRKAEIAADAAPIIGLDALALPLVRQGDASAAALADAMAKAARAEEEAARKITLVLPITRKVSVLKLDEAAAMAAAAASTEASAASTPPLSPISPSDGSSSASVAVIAIPIEALEDEETVTLASQLANFKVKFEERHNSKNRQLDSDLYGILRAMETAGHEVQKLRDSFENYRQQPDSFQAVLDAIEGKPSQASASVAAPRTGSVKPASGKSKVEKKLLKEIPGFFMPAVFQDEEYHSYFIEGHFGSGDLDLHSWKDLPVFKKGGFFSRKQEVRTSVRNNLVLFDGEESMLQALRDFKTGRPPKEEKQTPVSLHRHLLSKTLPTNSTYKHVFNDIMQQPQLTDEMLEWADWYLTTFNINDLNTDELQAAVAKAASYSNTALFSKLLIATPLSTHLSNDALLKIVRQGNNQPVQQHQIDMISDLIRMGEVDEKTIQTAFKIINAKPESDALKAEFVQIVKDKSPTFFLEDHQFPWNQVIADS